MAFLLAAASVQAAPPGWWSAPQTAILESGSAPNDFGPANLGQLKNAAARARKHLDLTLPGGAGPGVEARLAEWTSNADSYAPITLGQLKYVAKPFYDRLLEPAIHFDTKASLRSHQAAGETPWAWAYPWNPATPVSENFAPATIGQVKWVFSFDLAGYDSGNGLPDGWELFYFGSTGHLSGADDDGDGLSNLAESTAGSDPTKKDNPLLKLQVSVILK